MHTLEQLLQLSENGQKILDEAKKLGFESIRLSKNGPANTLFLIVVAIITEDDEFDPKPLTELESILARKFDCKVALLHMGVLSPEQQKYYTENSMVLPVNDPKAFTEMFNDPKQISIVTIKEDEEYSKSLTFDETALKVLKEKKDNQNTQPPVSSTYLPQINLGKKKNTFDAIRSTFARLAAGSQNDKSQPS